MKKTIHALAILSIALALYSCNEDRQPIYSVANIFPIEGDGFWDYISIDEKTHRLFVSHAMVTQVLNSQNGQLIGTVENTPGVHGIALNPELNKAYISCGADSTVVVIDLSTLDFISKIKVTGAGPDAIMYDNFSGNVFVFNGRSANVTVIDTKKDSVVSTIALAGKPEFSVSDGAGKVYVNIEDKSLVTVIDSKSLHTTNSWSLHPGEEPSGLALDKANHRLFAVCANKIMVVMNAMNGEIITSLPIGEGSDGCKWDPGLKRIYSSNGEGTLTVVQQRNKDEYAVLNTIQTQVGARTLCIDTITHHIYLPTAKRGKLPEPTPENPEPRPEIVKGSFVVLDIAPN